MVSQTPGSASALKEKAGMLTFFLYSKHNLGARNREPYGQTKCVVHSSEMLPRVHRTLMDEAALLESIYLDVPPVWVHPSSQ